MKKILYAIALLFLTLLGLLGIVLTIAGFVDNIVPMAVCGLVFLLLSVIGCVRVIRKIHIINPPNISVLNNKKKKRKEIQCVICGNHDKYRFFSESDIGDVCKKCIRKLYQMNLLHDKKKYSLSELRNMLGVFSNQSNEIDKIMQDECAPKEKIQKLIVSNPNISLLNNEICFYKQVASAYHQKNIVIGSSGKTTGMNIRIAKGISVRTGGGRSRVIRKDVVETFVGTLYITNYRIILLAPKCGFDLYVSKINQLTYNNDGFQIYHGSKCYNVLTCDVDNIQAVIQLLNEQEIFEDEKIANKQEKKKTETQIVNEIRQYKKLYDEGVISEDEFTAKKKQLLELQ